MVPVPAMTRPGHQIGNQENAQGLGQDDRGAAAGRRGDHVPQSAGARADHPEVPSGKWLEFGGGVISGLFNQPGRRWRAGGDHAMTTDSMTTEDDATLFLGEAWSDPIEAGIRDRIRGFIES